MSITANIFKSTALTLSLIAGLFIAETVSAQVTDEVVVEGRYLYTDQVNALKTPVPILNVPQSLSIITNVDIRQQGFRELADIARYTPGVNTSQGEGHRDSIVFRGVRSTADFYLDGVRDDVQYYRSLYNLEQVEVLRGPNALLFGRGGTGGIVNRVTKKATTGETYGAIDIGADSFGAYDVAGDYNIATSDKTALRINAHYDALENHRDFYDGERIGFNPTLKIELSARTTLDLSYEYADHERFIDRGIPTQNGEPVEAFEKITFGDKNINLTTLEAQIFRGLLSHEFSDTMKGNLTVHYGDYEKMYKNLYASDYDGTNVTMDGYEDPTERTNMIISGNLIKEFDLGSTQHVLLVGLEHIETENENLRYNTFWSTTGNDKETFNVTRPMNFTVNSGGVATSVDFTTDLNNQTKSDITVTSFLLQDQIDVSEKFKIMLGARLDNFDITVDDIDDATSASREDEEVSPRAGLIYKPQENLSLYASYSESFLPRSGEQFKKLSANDSRLDPDVFENVEFGIKWDIRPNLSFTMSYFDSEQTQAVRDSVTGEASEVLGLSVDGIELELKGQLTDQLTFAAGYSNFDGETSSGGEPREIPEYTFSVWSTYQVTEKLGVGLGVTHQGESNIKNDSVTPILPDYTRVDLAAYYDIDEDMTLQLNIENLTDELYFPHAHSTHQATVGEPLNARVSIRRNF